MAEVTVREASLEDANEIFRLVTALLEELGEEGDETGALDRDALLRAWRSDRGRQFVYLARENGACVGIVTVAEAFAIYAHGHYGIINEMYVVPGRRSAGVGALLLEAVRDLGRRRGWRRVDVTAPESERWSRTRRFYEEQGFRFTGPKLKHLLETRESRPEEE